MIKDSSENELINFLLGQKFLYTHKSQSDEGRTTHITNFINGAKYLT